MTTKLRSGRPTGGLGGWISPSQRIKWGDAVRAALAANPHASVAELAAQTGSPPELARTTRLRWLQRREARAA